MCAKAAGNAVSFCCLLSGFYMAYNSDIYIYADSPDASHAAPIERCLPSEMRSELHLKPLNRNDKLRRHEYMPTPTMRGVRAAYIHSHKTTTKLQTIIRRAVYGTPASASHHCIVFELKSVGCASTCVVV